MGNNKRQRMNARRETAWRPTLVYSGNGKPIEKHGKEKLFRESETKADAAVPVVINPPDVHLNPEEFIPRPE